MIEVLHDDITTLRVDAIVNAANATLLGGGGVDGAIHRAAGPQLREACRELGGCETGNAKITPGFELPAKWVIHTVGPVWKGGGQNEAHLLNSCYERSFKLALEHSVQSIAFPCISTGAYRYPAADAARIALSIMKDFQDKMERIIACCFSERDAKIYRNLLSESGSS